MDARRVLMIIPFFPPNAGGGAYRPLGFVKNLGQYGWQPIVLTMDSKSYWITDESLLADVPRGCEVHRTSTMSGQAMLSFFRSGRGDARKQQVRSSRRFGALRKVGAAVLVPDTYVGWFPFAVGEGQKILREKSIHAIYSTSPPETSHLIAERLHRVSGLPWVADFRDPWMNLHLLRPPTPLHARLHARFERRVCKRAAVVVTNAWHRDLLVARYPWIARPTVIPNGYDASHVGAVMDVAPAPDRFQIVHAGMLTQKRSAVPLLKALRIFLDEVPAARDRCRVLFLGPRESENDAAVENLGLSGNVTFRDTVPHPEALKIQRSSHILVLIKHANTLYDGIVPGKLYEYIGLRRPILALAPEGEASRIVREHKRGEVVQLDDPAAIAGKIRVMYEKYLGGTLDTDYDLSPIPDYRRDVLTKTLAGLLDSLRTGRM